MNRTRLMAKGEGWSEKEVGESRNKDRKTEIYQKALDLFLKKGYDATPMSMTAKVLGMSKANLLLKNFRTRGV
jgi:AcrR family transcriptional regulator